MAIETSCPGTVHLHRYALGQASANAAAAVAEHLKHCSRCLAIVAELKADNWADTSLGDEAEEPDEPSSLDAVAHPVTAPEGSSETTLLSSCDEADESSDPTVPVSADDGNRTSLLDVSSQDEDRTAEGDPSQSGTFPSDANSRETCAYEGADAVPATILAGQSSPGQSAAVIVPGYEILEELGRGGMGVVYKARHLRLQRLVALKMILAGSHAGPNRLARFRAEAEAVARLQHPNIVQIYETGEYEGRPYISLEFVEGGSLEQRMKESSTTPRAAAELVEMLAHTMDIAHQRGIVHRDLKPGNILLAAGSVTLSSSRDSASAAPRALQYFPKIADFGLAKRVDDDSSQTQSGAILGTPCYMAPEQAEGKTHEIGPAADIYSLGAILYDLLVGRPPFKAGNPIDTIRQVVEQDPVPPRQLEPRVPHDLETICLKCLEKEPARRYASAAELAADLRRFLDDEPIHARPTPAWERAWKWGKRRPTTVALLGVSLAALLGMVLFIVWHNVALREERDEARAEERLAREREQKALEGQRLTRMQNEGQKLLDTARLAVAAHDWPNARLHLTKALTVIGSEAGFEDLKEPAQALLKQVEGELHIETERRDSLARLQKFAALRDEAQFLGTLYTGMDFAANRDATRAAVRKALAVYGISTDADGRPQLDAYLDDRQKSEILADCYQLLLILAENEVQSSPSSEQEKRVHEALRLLKQALRFGSPSRAWHLRQARYLDLLGDEAGAQREEKAAADAPLLHDLDHFLVADEFYRRGDFDGAIKEFDQVLQLKPGHFWAEYLGALCLLRQHRAAEARARLDACLAQRADFVWLYLLRGFAQGELREFDAADADFQKAWQMPLDENSRYVLLVNRGVLRVKQDRVDDAITDLKSAIELKPSEYEAYVNLAQAYRRQKKLDLALEQLQQAIRREPLLAHLYRLRGRLYLERKEPALALKDFDQTIRLENTNSPLLADDHVERGRLLLHEGKYAEALTSFDKALVRRKDHLPAQRLRAEALFGLGRFQDAVEAFDRYLEKGKALESVYRGRGLARAELGKYPGAIEDYTKALELRPTSEVYAYRGWAHLVCDAPKLALRDFQLAIEIDSKNGDAYNGRGFVLVNQGQLREAIRNAETAVRHGPKSPRLLYNAARICAQCGGDSEPRALELIEQALELLTAEQRPAFWSKYVRSDPALDAIRRYPRFRQLETEMARRK